MGWLWGFLQVLWSPLAVNAPTTICVTPFRDNDDPEKMSKLEESVPAPSMATPPMPPVAMATPPPPMMGGDMSGSHYGYGGWYQVLKLDNFSQCVGAFFNFILSETIIFS